MTTLVELEAFLVSNRLSLTISPMGSLGWRALLSRWPPQREPGWSATAVSPVDAIEAAVAVFEARNETRAKAV